MKAIFEKKINKVIIGAVLGSAILGLGGFSMSPKGKKFHQKVIAKLKSSCGFLKGGFDEMFKFVGTIFKFKLKKKR